MLPVVVRLLPDGTKRVRIHWFQEDVAGPIQTQPSQDHPGIFPGAKGKIACIPQSQGLSVRLPGGQYQPVICSPDPRAVTCPECMDTQAFKDLCSQMQLTLDAKIPGRFQA